MNKPDNIKIIQINTIYRTMGTTAFPDRYTFVLKLGDDNKIYKWISYSENWVIYKKE